MSIRALLLASASIAFCGVAHAECQYKPFQFFPEQNDRVTVPATVEGGAFCRHKFMEGGGYRFTQVAPETQPQHGALGKDQDGSFIYVAQPGYTGEDRYGFKVCATKEGRKGCSRITIAVNVTPKNAAQTPTGCAVGAPEAMAACAAIIADKDKSASERSRAWRVQGVSEFRARNLDKALAAFTSAIELSPDDGESYNNRGLVHQFRRELDAAIADYDKALAILPSLNAALVNRANAYRLKGDISAARIDAERAIAQGPNFAPAWKARGQVRAAEGKYAEAIADYSKALEIAPGDEDVRLLRASAYHRAGDDDKALADYATIVRDAPQHATAYGERARLFLDRSDYALAADNLDSAMKIDPKNPALLNMRGVAAMQTGKFDPAIADFTAVMGASSEPGVYGNRGMAYFGKGDFTAAAADFEKLAAAGLQKAYAPLWVWMAKNRAGETAAAPAMPADADAWPAPVYSYLAGKINRVELFAAALKGDQKAQDSQVCDASFYAGEKMLIDKKPVEAELLMSQAGVTCKGSTLERAGALGEYMRMKK